MTELNFNQLVQKIKAKSVYMLIGHGSKNQFKSVSKTKLIVKNIIEQWNENSVVLYFGDAPKIDKPDVGLLFQMIHELNKNIKIYMIQISVAKGWGVPKFVSGVYWHNDFTKKCQWGGINDNNEPCSNTKKWVSLNKRINGGIKMVYIFGGGNITLDEYKLIKKYKIPYQYFQIERKYKGDGITKVLVGDSIKDKIGVTFNKIK